MTELKECLPRIVYADDDQEIRELGAFVLQYNGFEVIEAEDGREAIEKTLEFHPDLVILDVRMPRLSGYEAIKYLKCYRPVKNIPIVIFSAHGQEAEISFALELGASDYIVKPFAPDTLIRSISSLIGEISQSPASKIWHNNTPNEAFAEYKQRLISTPLVEELEDISFWLTKIADSRCVESLLICLNYNDNPRKGDVIETLGRLRVKAAIPKIVEIVISKASTQLRSISALALGNIGDVNSISVLGNALNYDHNHVANAAAKALGNIMDDASIVYLGQALAEHKSPNVRKTAADMLGRIASPTAADILAHALHHDKPSIGIAAARALGNIGDDASIIHLGQALIEHKSPKVKKTAADMLGRIASPAAADSLAHALHHDKPSIGIAAAKAFGNIGDDASIIHLGQALAEHKSPDVRKTAADMLGRIASPTAADILAHALHHDKPSIGIAAARALGNIGDDASIIHLGQALAEHKSPKVKKTAADMLGRIASPAAADSLAHALHHDKPSIGIAAAKAFGNIGDDASIIHLGQALAEHKSPDVRKTAADMLGRIASPAAADSLVHAFHHEENFDVLIVVTEALGNNTVAGSVRTLRLASKNHQSKRVREISKRQLKYVESIIKNIALLDSDYLVLRGESVIRLANLAKHSSSLTATNAQKTFWANVRHSLPSVTDNASSDENKEKWGKLSDIAFALSGERQYQNKMLREIVISKREPELLSTALSALGHNIDEDSVDLIIDCTSHENHNIRRSAVDALGRIKKKSTASLMIKMLDDPSPSVRLAVVMALASLDTSETIQALNNELQRGNKHMRIDVTKALGHSKNLLATRSILQHILREKDTDVLHSSIQALETKVVEDGTIIEILTPFLDHPSDHVRQVTTKILK
ncbi:HEAT repeat domain-containing protein [Candidatus Leptofilum sp.]|uniref:HEAT repeat domain-containing protein n=1 Tax=Candidatus Leptofilum sp. TaxID=3241576 RepID=UPI003B5B0BA6